MIQGVFIGHPLPTTRKHIRGRFPLVDMEVCPDPAAEERSAVNCCPQRHPERCTPLRALALVAGVKEKHRDATGL